MDMIAKLQQKITLSTPKQILIWIMIAQFLLHLPIFSLPPMGQHVWRQVIAHSQARNYFEEGNEFLYPTLDVRFSSDDKGIIYKEFPLMYWLTGPSYKITGFHQANARLTQFFAGLLLLFGAFRIARALGATETQQKWYVFFLGGSPYFFYYSVTFMPDVPAMACFLIGISMLLPYLRTRKNQIEFWLGLPVLALALLFKGVWLFFGLVIAQLFLESYFKFKEKKIFLISIASGAIILLPMALQMNHQAELAALAPMERGGEAILSYSREMPESWLKFFQIMQAAMGTWFLQLYVNLAAVPMFFVGLYTAIKSRSYLKTENGRFWFSWFISFFIFFLAFFYHFHADGGYYSTPILPFAAWFSTMGATLYLERPRWRKAIIILACILPTVMIFRVEARWHRNAQVPIELRTHASEITNLIPKDGRVLVVWDQNYSVALYYIKRKGYTWPYSLSRQQLIGFKNRGIGWILFFRENGEIPAWPEMIELKGEVGRYQVYKIK